MKESTMERTLVLAAVAALALAVAPPAVAKEIKSAQVCGADGCTATDDSGDRAVLVNGGPPRTPPTAAPFYTLRVTIDTGGGHTDGFEMAAVPERRALRASDGTWLEMPPDVAAVIAKLATGHRAFPASGLTGAARAPKPHPASAGTGGSPLWPEGVLIAVVLAVGGVFLVRAARGSRRVGPASS
jgi:hypothetical protein